MTKNYYDNVNQIIKDNNIKTQLVKVYDKDGSIIEKQGYLIEMDYEKLKINGKYYNVEK